MLSVFNRGVRFRAKLLGINVVNTWQQETAYFGNSWGNVMSTVMYTLTYLIFISIIFANTKTMAGYSRDQMIFLLLFIQINFYLLHMWSFNNVARMVDDVNLGSFDLILTKPLPALYYSSIRNLDLVSMLRDAVPSIAMIALSINWSQLQLGLGAIVAAVLIVILGQLVLNVFFFLLGVPVFWFGQSADLLGLSYSFMAVDLPYEGVGRGLRLVFTTIIPAMLASALAVSVALGKTAPLVGLGFAFVVAISALMVKVAVWKLALRSYTSASS